MSLLQSDLFNTICQHSISISLSLSHNCHECRVVNVTPCKTEYFEAKRLALVLVLIFHGKFDIHGS